MQNKLIFILTFANIFVIGTFSFWIDICNDKKHRLLHQATMQKYKNEINKYRIKFQAAKAENTKLERIKISKEELEKKMHGKD